jgi:uncharacterized membrane protein
MAEVPVQVIVAAFNDLEGASNALKTLKEAKHAGIISIEDAAVITKDANSSVKIRETADMGPGKGALIGAIAGGVVGLLLGPVGLVAVGGGAIGALAARLHDSGFPDERLRQLSDGLTPGSSALVAVVEHRWVRQVQRELQQAGADLVTEAVRDDIARQLQGGGSTVYSVITSGDDVVIGHGTRVGDVIPSADLPAGEIAGMEADTRARSDDATFGGGVIAGTGGASTPDRPPTERVAADQVVGGQGSRQAEPRMPDGQPSMPPESATQEQVPQQP